MPVYCAHCNEELFGAVNRCWKCGRHFSARPSGGSQPPIRRAPVAGPVMLVREERGVVIIDDVPAALAEVVDRPQGQSADSEPVWVATLGEEPGPPQATAPVAPTPPAPAPLEPPRQPGSPFASGWIDDQPFAAAELVEPEDDGWNRHAAALSVVLGGIACIAAFFGWWGLVVGIVGLAAGTWGLSSRQRMIATVGLGLSCAAIALAEFQTAVGVYMHYNIAHPLSF